MAISEPLGSGLFVGTIAFAAVILGSRAEQKVGGCARSTVIDQACAAVCEEY